jgi:DNA (cytosine-5)-methyltransferase 1
MTKPRLLDLFCGAGGAAVGYDRAGFEIIGVDIEPQPHYPFEFHQGEVIGLLDWMLEVDSVEFSGFDVIHASPPCQADSTMTARWGRQDEHPRLIAPVRRGLEALGVPYVIENVPGAPLISPLTLCGSMFGLRDAERQLRRHRLFESNVWLWPPGPCHHARRSVGVYGNPGGSSARDGITFGSVEDWREAMGIDWMNREELREAIPPAFTEFIGHQLIQALRHREAA